MPWLPSRKHPTKIIPRQHLLLQVLDFRLTLRQLCRRHRGIVCSTLLQHHLVCAHLAVERIQHVALLAQVPRPLRLLGLLASAQLFMQALMARLWPSAVTWDELPIKLIHAH